jgi:IS30 family transposase
VERKTRYALLVPLPHGHSAGRVADALISAFSALPGGLRRTLTWDQGNEMFQHPRIEQATGLKIYFTDPHSPWQRGSNEKTNGLLRQYLPYARLAARPSAPGSCTQIVRFWSCRSPARLLTIPARLCGLSQA